MKSRWLAYTLVLVAWMSFGSACKGGGGDASSFIMVVNTSPEDERTDVQVETRIGFQINAPIDPVTVTSETFFVTDSQGTRVQGDIAIDPAATDAVVLTPDGPLSVITDFTATVTTELASLGGATLEKDFTWRFTTLDSAWGTSEWIEDTGTGSSAGQQIAVDGQSNALAIWEYEEQSGTSIWANRYTRVELWGEPEVIDSGNGGATDPAVSADGAGNGFAVWREGEGPSDGNIWTNRYDVEQGSWGTAELLQNGEVTTAQYPAVAADAAGNAIAIWFQRDSLSSNVVVWSNRYAAGVGWGAAEPIDEMPSPTVGLVTAVGMDATGDAIAIWTRGDAIWANRYTSAVWGTAELIQSDGATDAFGARLDVGANGDAFVVWVQTEDTTEGPRNDIWGNRFSGSSWGGPERIDTEDRDTIEADVAVDGMGIAHVVWSQDDGDFRNIWARQYTPGAGWGTSELIEPPNDDPIEDDDATVPRVEVNTDGNVFVVWRQLFDGWGSVWSNRLDPEMAWMPETAELIEQITRAARGPQIVVDENRHAHASWLHNIDNIDQDFWVRTNRFE